MRSSGSTPSPRPSRPVPLFVLLAGEDHPRACTGRRLLHRGLAIERSRSTLRGLAPIVLDPYARLPLLRSDRALAETAGVLAVDCSWNRLSERGRFPDAPAPGVARRLPILVATNPQHYGRVAQLNTVEALAAALVLVGHPTEAGRLLEGFRGADQFLAVNRGRLDAYAAASDAAELEAVEGRLFGGPEHAVSPAGGSSAPRSPDARPERPPPK